MGDKQQGELKIPLILKLSTEERCQTGKRLARTMYKVSG